MVLSLKATIQPTIGVLVVKSTFLGIPHLALTRNNQAILISRNI